MMGKPLIAITVEGRYDPEDTRTNGKIELPWNYAQAVADAGGVPIVIPPVADMEEIARIADGWLIAGGSDIDATRWGEDNHPAAELQDPSRYAGEEALYRAVPSELPVLGICYGCQFLNVVRGGSLIQHLPDEDKPGHSGGALQDYDLSPSRLAEIFGSRTVTGKSYHHQAVGRVAEGLKVVGHSADGVVEAVEASDRPWMFGVQWHPERTLQDERSRALFQAFVDAAAAYRNRKGA